MAREPGFSSKMRQPGYSSAAMRGKGTSDDRNAGSLPPIQRGKGTSEDRSAGSLPPIHSNGRETSLPRASQNQKRSVSLGRLKESEFDDGAGGSLGPLPRISAAANSANPGNDTQGNGYNGGARPPRPARPTSRQRCTDTPPQSSPQKPDPGPRQRQRSQSRGLDDTQMGEGYPPPARRPPHGEQDAIAPQQRQAPKARSSSRGTARQAAAVDETPGNDGAWPAPDRGHMPPTGARRRQAAAVDETPGNDGAWPAPDRGHMPPSGARRRQAAAVDETPGNDGAWPAPDRGHMPPSGARRARPSSNGAENCSGVAGSAMAQDNVDVAAPQQSRRPAQQRSANSRDAKTSRPPVAQPASNRPQSPPIPTLASSSNRPPSPPIHAAAATPFGGAGPEGEDSGESEPLMPCRHCSRSFRPAALERHKKICVKVFQKERPKFNAMEHILPDEAKAVVKPGARGKAKAKPAPAPAKAAEGKEKWRKESEAFRAAIRDARVVDKFKKEGRPLSELPPPKATDPDLDTRTPCPHCGRRFGDAQAERHIASCAKTKNKPKGPPAGRPPAARMSKAR